MKVLVPFYPHYASTEKADYFKIAAAITNGEIVTTDKNNFFQLIRKVWGQDVHGHGRGFPFPQIACFFTKKSVYTFHNNFIGQKWHAIILRRFIFNHYDKIIVQSEFARKNYIGQGIKTDKLALIPLPIDYKYYSQNKGNGNEFKKRFNIGVGEQFAFSIGTSYHKNPEIIVEACKLANIKLVIAGFKDKMQAKSVYGGFKVGKEIAADTDNVIFTGHLRGADFLSAFDAAAIYVNSSDEDGEAMGSAVFEAASAGVALCVPDYGTFDAFKGSALFHKNHDAKALAENIKKYMADPNLRKTNGEKAQKIASNFDYDIVRKQYEDLYKELGIIGGAG
ncbi:MAG: glycosyltransferase family 4 protein [Elusimicrobia bacterium]|nr:glycosyltransferase family 4 protein [Elusimicrobiota bacterium]